MNRLRYAALAVLVFCITLLLFSRYAEAAPPVDPRQPRPDLFSCGTFTCDVYNPVTIKAKATRTVSYRVQVEPGCTAGTIPADLEAMNAEAQKVGLNLYRDDFAPDFTVHINCGSEQIRRCASINTFCLNRNYPYSSDMDISDILSTYFPITRLSILLHEVAGHAVGSWNEQYQVCGASCNFAPSPGWRDFMGTGELSRHGFEDIELGRWARTMWEIEPESCPGPIHPSGLYWDACRQAWVNDGGWFFTPMDGIWHQPDGTPEWGACDLINRDCWNFRAQSWVFAGSLLFDPRSGVFSRPPLP